jgi:hypothetical protein
MRFAHAATWAMRDASLSPERHLRTAVRHPHLILRFAARLPHRSVPRRSETRSSHRPLCRMRQLDRRGVRRISPQGPGHAASSCVTDEPSWTTSQKRPNERSMFGPVEQVVQISHYSPTWWFENHLRGRRPRVRVSKCSTLRSTLPCLRLRSRNFLTLSSPNLRYQPTLTLAFTNETHRIAFAPHFTPWQITDGYITNAKR